MQAATDRRSHEDDRVPLDALIELIHAEGSEVLEADAVDVSSGGLSLRASFMPPIGARMQCRFACPPEGDRVVADCEVVWSMREGPHAGAFGVRFLALDTRSATLIRRLLEPPDPRGRAVRAAAPPPQRPLACLYIDGLGAPIEADVQLDETDHVLLSQRLDFLRLGRGVRLEIDGQVQRVGRIASVHLEPTPGDVPALSLGVLIDPPEPALRCVSDAASAPQTPTAGHHAAPDANLPAMQAPEPFEPLHAARARSAEPLGPTDTWPSSPPFELDGPPAEVVQGHAATAEPGPPGAESAAVRDLDSATAGQDAQTTEAAAAPADGEADRADGPQVAAVGEAAAALVRRTGATLQQVSLGVVARARAALAERAPAVRDGFRAALQLLLAFWARQTSRLKHFRRTQRRRRTTAPAPRVAGRAPRTAGRAAAASPARSGRGRLLGVGLVAFAGVAGAIYVLAPRRSASTLDLHRSVTPQLATPLAPEQPAADPAAPVATESTATAPAETSAPAEPEASPSESPEPAVEESPELVFGAASVPNGRTYSLRMSGPIDRIEGERRRDGFVVRVPGRLSLDRASPIATSHPALSRSLILNQGDRAELTIEFVKGKQPKYRVEAKDNALELTVERL